MTGRSTDTVRTPSVRARFARRTLVLLPAAIAALPFAESAHAAQIGTSWTAAASGSWFDATKWSAGVPNNVGANVYDATIGAAGAPYTVGLNGTITLNSLTLSSPAATINHTGGMLVSSLPVTVSAGTYALNGGTISGGTVNLSGTGTIGFGGSTGVLDGTVVNGGLTIDQFNARARLMDDARFTGNATVSGVSSILNFEHDHTLQSGQTITMTAETASVGIAKNGTTNTDSTLTIAPGAAGRGRGRITSNLFTGGSTTRVVNNGTIAADITGGTFKVEPTIFVNNGALEATNGATLTVGGGTTFTNNGSVNAGPGGAVNLTAPQWTNS